MISPSLRALLAEDISVFDVGEEERVILLQDSVALRVLAPGRHAFWTTKNVAVVRYDTKTVTAELPPVLIHHGDRDTLVTLDQSVRFRDRAREAGAEVTLVTVAGGGHGWLTMPLDVMQFAAFFHRVLRPQP